MALIEVDEKKCVHCGCCAAVCPAGVIETQKDGVPKAMNEQFCNGCGHCVAVCPAAALNHKRAPLAKQISAPKLPVLDDKTAENYLRSRRSVRCYKTKKVNRDQLEKLLNIARFAPTGSNSQGLSYMVIEQKEILEKATEATVAWMEEQVETKSFHASFPTHIHAWRSEHKDTVLRNAPHLVLAMAPKNLVNGRSNTISAFSYVELYAPAIGLGSCWAGLLEMCLFSGYEPLLTLFPIPKDKIITGALMVGYPTYQFKRLPDRAALRVDYL